MAQLDVRNNTALLTAVYSQSWPAPDPNKTPRKGFNGSHNVRSTSPRSTRQQSAINNHRLQSSRPPPHHHYHHQGGVGSGVNNLHGNQELSISGRGAEEGWGQPKGRSNGVVKSNDLPLHLGLDKGTLQWRSWSSFKQDIETVDKHEDDLSLYKITQDTFRKLTQQVSEVSEHLNNRYTSPGFQGVRRSQLAASLPSSHASIQNHKESEGDMEKYQSSLAIQPTPFKSTQRQRPKSHLVTSKRNKLHPPPRPHSSITTSQSKAANRYDRLSPSMISHLQGESIGVAGGGDATSTTSDQNLGPFDIVKDEYKLGSESEDESLDDRTLATEDFEYDDEDGRSESMRSLDMDSSEDEVDINERIDQIRNHREKMQRKLMRMDLPPEVLTGDIDCMFPYSGSTASKKKKQEPFAEALSVPYCHMDLLELSMLDKDWRTIIRTAPDKDDAVVMERMIEMEKLQYETAEWESGVSSPRRRCQSALGIRKGWNADAAVPTERAHSALGRPKQSKNCCDQCLQLVCAGDCPNKVAASYNSCVHCRQPYCNGACTDFGYHLHIRYARQEEKKKRRPKSCHTCRRSKTPNNVINTNNVILGRPRSGFATYSSSRVQSAKTRKMTVASTEGAEHVSNRMERLRLSAKKYEDKSSDDDDGGEGRAKKQRPRTAGSKRQVKGRDALISGKSYQSQRRFSLTEDPVTTTAASMNPKVLRVRSAHYRTRKARQKTKKTKKKYGIT